MPPPRGAIIQAPRASSAAIAMTLCPPAGDEMPAGPSVAVIGEALVDHFGDCDLAGGAPFNLARSLSAFGVPVTWVTRLGAGDAGAAKVLASAHRFGLTDDGVQFDPVRRTGAVKVVEHGTEHGFSITGDTAWEAIDLAPARRLLMRRPPSVLCYGTLAMRGTVTCETVTRLLRDTTALRVLDVNLRPGSDNRQPAAAALALADWVKVNEEELGHLIVWFARRCDPVAAAVPGSAARANAVRLLCEQFGIERLIVTRAEYGYEAFDKRGRIVAAGAGVALPIVVDTVGAGDAFLAALLAQHVAGRAFAPALAMANRYAAAVCADRGALPDDEEFFRSWRWTLGLQQPSSRSA